MDRNWEQELEEWLGPFLDGLGHRSRQHWAPVYLRGLIGPGERKSVQPMSARLAPADHEQLHHFVATSPWDGGPLETVLARKADTLVGGPEAVLIVDDTTLLKQGKHSVGVARQYSGAAGKTTNCQTVVSLTLARNEVPVPIALRLFLPEEWTDDPERCRRAGVPEERIVAKRKGEIAIEEIDRVRSAGVSFGAVVADAGYGISAEFRHALSARGLAWAVGIPRIQKAYPPDVELLPAVARGPGPAVKHPVPTAERRSAEEMLANVPWRRLSWRRGTKGPLAARFAALRVRVADGEVNSRAQHLPGEEAWLVGEHRTSGEKKYYLTNHPADTPLRKLAATIKARWACEQAHQQMKEELGLDHFEGRSWTGLHHHTLLTMIAFAFLQHLRLQAAGREKKAGRPSRATAPAQPAQGAATATEGP